MLTQITLGCLIKNVVPVTDGFWIQCSKKVSSSEKELFLFVDKNEKKVTTTIASCVGCIWDIENQDLYFWDASGIRIANKNISIELNNKMRLSVDARDQIECIRLYLSELISKTEKSTKLTKSNDFVKLHETSKMEASLIITKRRAILLESE